MTVTEQPVQGAAGRAAAPVPSPEGFAAPAFPGGVLLALTAAVITASSIAAYVNGRSGIDLAIFDQGLWVAGQGLDRPASVIRETLFEDHFAPGMLLFVALYKLVATPVWLFLAQGLAAFAAARLVARRLEPSVGPKWAALAGVGLLLSPPVAYALLWDFHSVVLAVPFGLAAVFALEDGRPRRALLFGLAAVLFRMDVGFAVLAAFAVWPGERRGRLRPAGLLFAALAVAQYLEQALGHDIFWGMHYGHLGATPIEAVTHPWRILTTFFSGRTLTKALPWLAGSGFACLLFPRRAIPAFVVALPVLFSHWPGTDTFTFQYGYAPVFLLALAWIPIARRPAGARWVVAAALAMAALLGPVLPAVVFPAPGYSYAASLWTPDHEVLCLTRGIPAGAGLSATPPALARLAHREAAYLWPFPFEAAPDNTLPGPQHRVGVPAEAAGVDYLIVKRTTKSPIPPGFIEDLATDDHRRFRRAARTSPARHTCR